VKETANVIVFKRTLDPAAVEWAAEKLVVSERLQSEQLKIEEQSEERITST
jgi:hypothetical protein